MIEIEIDDSAIRAALQNLLAVTGNSDDVLNEIGEHLAESTLHRFETKTGPNGKRWADNSPVTIERKGRNDPLIDHGSLSEQIHAQLLGDDTLAVGSSMEYAAVQQFGAKMGEFGRYSQIARVRKYGLGTFQGSAGTQKGFPLPWGDIPARPFLGVSEDDRDAILAIIQAHLNDAIG
ncbi:phage virion morphogenesis protein [Methylomicrobium sp. Wu6]|uniref:phage virion morphogenesis protein n=1 Tax=Methylomicrobium sp. Wu6 TaxID=3107928 RepID=UPI002DD63D56|nr:phage virion morphogenesis protein [Methylomicrobium sp. Wu6]MEC4750042.1 phage virion morphogenesis protein [Methylomicrobium sp. Wu6]